MVQSHTMLCHQWAKLDSSGALRHRLRYRLVAHSTSASGSQPHSEVQLHQDMSRASTTCVHARSWHTATHINTSASPWQWTMLQQCTQIQLTVAQQANLIHACSHIRVCDVSAATALNATHVPDYSVQHPKHAQHPKKACTSKRLQDTIVAPSQQHTEENTLTRNRRWSRQGTAKLPLQWGHHVSQEPRSMWRR